MTETARLPDGTTEQTYDAVSHDEAALRPGVDALCTSLGLDARLVQRFPTGSLPVYAAGDVVLKLFPPVHVEELPVEAGVLSAVAGRLPVATPALHTTGTHDGWGYVVMDRLPGVDLARVWPDLDRGARCRLAAQAGAMIAALHEVPPPAIEDWWPTSWPSFLDEQRRTAVARQRARGLDPQWLDQVPAFLATTPLRESREVLLHTEVMPANLLAAPDAEGRWSLSGLCDFEPAMRGSVEYDLVAPAVFMAEGDPLLLREALTAYGYQRDELDHDLSRRLMAWTLLHCYGNLAVYLQRLPGPDAPTLDALARSWFGSA